MSTPITGVNTHFVLDNSAGTPTDISAYCSRITPSTDQQVFEVNVFKQTRATEVAGRFKETWDIEGPWTPEADAFWRALARQDAGKGIDYILGPDGSTTGKTKLYGTCNVNDYAPQSFDAEAVNTYKAQISILTQTVGTF